MSSSSRSAAFFLSVVLMLSSVVSVFADTVRLKDGSIIKGRITDFSGGKFTIEIGEGERKRTLTFDAADVDSITFDSFERASSTTNRPGPGSASIPPRYETVVTNSTSNTRPSPTRPTETAPANSNTQTTSDSTTPPAANTAIKPIELSIKVLADNTANGWTNSGWVVKKGQRIRISGTGEVSLGKGIKSTPAGLWDVEDPNKLLKAVPTGALLAVIGDDNNDFLFIGDEREFVAARDGALFLGINEGNLNDNSGAFNVKIEIFPGI
ncbi:hypothetical protein [Leptolyngbya sp. 7M]|uniref:hypothetical protein n=1 Tax=Leptolyngbya sp. 7M TaxID=2812896 RepID=UPI001B8BCDE5|nr:hypothetical protein [Leptolyngbya sp. 7M]QYO61968.1 LecA/PA-IL family lectin [Leptolyngbya sp. 7M]